MIRKHLMLVMQINKDRLRAAFARNINRIIDQRPPFYRHQGFGFIFRQRPHAAPETSGKNHNGKRGFGHHAHLNRPI